MSWRHILRISMPLAAVAITGFVAFTHRNSASPVVATETAVSSSQHTGQAALRVHIDPETGQLGAAPKPAVPLQLDSKTIESLRRDDKGLVEVHNPDGSVSVHLQGRFQSAAVAHIGENGKITICSEDAEDVHNALTALRTDDRTAEVK